MKYIGTCNLQMMTAIFLSAVYTYVQGQLWESNMSKYRVQIAYVHNSV